MFNRKFVVGLGLSIVLGMFPVNVYAGEPGEVPVMEAGENGNDETSESPVRNDGDVEINETNFPDEAFRQFVLEKFGDGGTVISAERIREIMRLDCSNRDENGIKIKDLRGIEYFTALMELNCCGNQLTSLDVSSCLELEDLQCENNQLTSLDVSGCLKLERLNCINNQLTALDVSGCLELENLNCKNNQLTSLDVGGCLKLISLTCSSNQLTSLDVSGFPVLNVLICPDNQLTSLKVNDCPRLHQFDCARNQLSSLDVSGCSLSTDFSCSNNQLTSLDVSGNPRLSYFSCYNNQLTGLDVSNNPNLQSLSCFNNRLTSLDVSGNASLKRLYCGGNQISCLDFSNNPELEDFGSGAMIYILVDGEGSYDTSTLFHVEGSQMDMSRHDSGFDPAKVKETKHLEQEGSTFTLTGDKVGNLIGWYVYDCGQDYAMKVALKSDGRVEPSYPPAEDIFIDVPTQPGYWKYESVKYVSERGIMGGVGGSDQFQPDNQLTRAMFATVLYRMAGEPQVEYSDRFKDVEEGIWYSDAVLWAAGNGIVSGYTDGRYGINDNITREQIAKMLHRYGEVKGYDVTGMASLEHFTDKDTVSGWAVEHVQWAVYAGMISGKPNDADNSSYRIDPKGEATRAECAKMLMMFLEKYKEPEVNDASFSL